jgi:DNA-binding NtrC family response regulator
VPEHLVESALFGHEARALPDSERTHSGLIERASESVLVENLEDLTKETQRKLLAAIQKRHFTRVGGTERIETRVRFIATTSADLDDLVRSGQVLADLRDCLGTIAFDLPPLRSRISDLPALAEQFLAKERVGSNDTERPRLNRRALDALEAHTWPGNLRELRDVMRSVALTARCREVDSNGLPPNLAGRAQTPGSALTPDFEPEIDLLHPLPSLVRSANERAERCYLELLLERNAGRIDATARASGLSRRSISAKLNKYGINKDRFKTPRGSESIRMGD